MPSFQMTTKVLEKLKLRLVLKTATTLVVYRDIYYVYITYTDFYILAMYINATSQY